MPVVTVVCEKQILRSAQDMLWDTQQQTLSSLLRVARNPRVILSDTRLGPRRPKVCGVSVAKDLLFKNH